MNRRLEVLREEDFPGLNVKVCRSMSEFKDALSSEECQRRSRLERFIATESAQLSEFHLPGFCMVCDTPASFLVDQSSGATWEGSVWIPNWRERGACTSCGLNNRQRAIFTFLKSQIPASGKTSRIYLTEQVTPVYTAFSTRLAGCEVVGSEFLGMDLAPGTIRDGIRHEDLEKLSFETDSYDFVVSNDVLEHVNDPAAALREIRRVLKPGGAALLTFPFHSDRNENETRARLKDGELEFLLPAEYHGNPVSSEGSLVYTDFGWDVLDLLASAGFDDVGVVLYWSYEHCHLGAGQLYFQAR